MATMVMKRSQQAMSTRWVVIQAQVNSFHGYHNEIEQRTDSSTTPIDQVYMCVAVPSRVSLYVAIHDCLCTSLVS
jgi:uncharacterized protein YerC